MLKTDDGIWPCVHYLFLRATGAELTSIWEEDRMAIKFIRTMSAKVILGLRPWEVLTVEQAMDRTYGGKWYHEPLGTYTTKPPCILILINIYHDLSAQVYNKYEDAPVIILILRSYRLK